MFFFVFFCFFLFFFVFLLSLADSLENVISNKILRETKKTKFLYQAVIVYIRID